MRNRDIFFENTISSIDEETEMFLFSDSRISEARRHTFESPCTIVKIVHTRREKKILENLFAEDKIAFYRNFIPRNFCVAGDSSSCNWTWNQTRKTRRRGSNVSATENIRLNIRLRCNSVKVNWGRFGWNFLQKYFCFWKIEFSIWLPDNKRPITPTDMLLPRLNSISRRNQIHVPQIHFFFSALDKVTAFFTCPRRPGFRDFHAISRIGGAADFISSRFTSNYTSAACVQLINLLQWEIMTIHLRNIKLTSPWVNLHIPTEPFSSFAQRKMRIVPSTWMIVRPRFALILS